MKPDADLPAAVFAYQKKLMSGLAPFIKETAIAAEIQMENARMLSGVLRDMMNEWMAQNGYDLEEITRVTKGNEHSDVEARVLFVRKGETINLVQAGIVNLQINEDGRIEAKNVRFTRSWLSIGGGEPFRISTGAQSKLLGFFFKDTRTIKTRLFMLAHIIEKLEPYTYQNADKYEKLVIRKRYLNARRYINAKVRANAKTSADLIAINPETNQLYMNMNIIN